MEIYCLNYCLISSPEPMDRANNYFAMNK